MSEEEDRSLNAAIAAHASWANTSNRTARHIASAEIPPASRVTRRAQPDALGSDLGLSEERCKWLDTPTGWLARRSH